MDDSSTGSDFLRRRLHQQRMRLAAQHSLRSVAGRRDQRLHLAFDDAGELIQRATLWAQHAAPWVDESIEAAAPRQSPPAINSVPRLAIAILVVGSRGDVQPFIPIALSLAKHHRVRLATHERFRSLIEDAGLEFFPLAGDPHELMEYMVRTGGRILPVRIDQLIEDVPRKRQLVGDIAQSTWRACIGRDPARNDAAPFTADLIIANPPSYGHIHCAEALNVPLHMIFTMPWTPTRMYPHPMTQLDPASVHPVQNYLSYSVVNTLMWGGVADLMNSFRTETLGLAPLDMTCGNSLLDDAEVPMAYLFPESLVPRPPDWGPYVDLTNFIFWDRASTYQPPDDLSTFLEDGEAPVYIGFGSCVVDNPETLTTTIFAALERAGLRGVLSRGWAGIGGTAPANVCLIDDVPHDWLFPRCRAVCHHGGAGTTAAGLRAGLPTVVVPFFGDQFFWGQVVSDAGAGRAIAVDDLTAEALAEAFAFCATAEIRSRAAELAKSVKQDDGVAMVVDAVHSRLPLRAMRCTHGETHLATLWCEPCAERLCAACARDHAGHTTKAYRWMDWSVRPSRGLIEKLRDLAGDAAAALGVAPEELVPRDAPPHDGVVLDGEPVEDIPGSPVHRSAPVRP